jgi:hypothetical protein
MPGEAHEQGRSPREIPARYDGRCARCGRPKILKGDPIKPIPGEDGWLCEDCA